LLAVVVEVRHKALHHGHRVQVVVLVGTVPLFLEKTQVVAEPLNQHYFWESARILSPLVGVVLGAHQTRTSEQVVQSAHSVA
jgi:hypothetical protein